MTRRAAFFILISLAGPHARALVFSPDAGPSAQLGVVAQTLAQAKQRTQAVTTPPQRPSTTIQNVRLSDDPNLSVDPDVPSSTIEQRTKLDPTVSAFSPGYGTALAKRRPRASVSANLPSDRGIKPPTLGDWEFKAQVRNTLTMANVSDLQDDGGKNFQLQNEVRVGFKHKSGYGFAITGTYLSQDYSDPSKNVGQAQDASVILYHPSIYKDNTFDLYGQFRLYAPTSEVSRENDIHSGSYYSFLDITLPHKFSMSNTFITRVFSQPAPLATSPTSVFYNALELYHQTAKGISLAIGGQYEADNLAAAPTGTELDIYPFIDFAILPNILIEPKYYFPVFISGGGSVGASGAALNQTQAELFIKIAI